MNQAQLYVVVPMLYGVAVVASLFFGGFLPVLIIGAMLSGVVYTVAGMSRRRRRQP
jgi:hypothetical protein